jgi:uncharacterized glyoxalase superfamily protein PhnB
VRFARQGRPTTSRTLGHRELVAAGAESRNEPWDAYWGQRYAQVKDPDGNVIDLFAPLPPRCE